MLLNVSSKVFAYVINLHINPRMPKTWILGIIHREKKSVKLPQERPFEFTVRFHVYFT